MSNVTSFELDTQAKTVTAGAGHTNGLLMASVAKEAPGFATLIGSCPRHACATAMPLRDLLVSSDPHFGARPTANPCLPLL